MFPPPTGPGVSNDHYLFKRETELSFTREESITNDALLAALSVPRELLRARSTVPITPRHGFSKREPGVYEVLDTGRHELPTDRRMDYSGSYGSYSGTHRPGLGLV